MCLSLGKHPNPGNVWEKKTKTFQTQRSCAVCSGWGLLGHWSWLWVGVWAQIRAHESWKVAPRLSGGAWLLGFGFLGQLVFVPPSQGGQEAAPRLVGEGWSLALVGSPSTGKDLSVSECGQIPRSRSTGLPSSGCHSSWCWQCYSWVARASVAGPRSQGESG